MFNKNWKTNISFVIFIAMYAVAVVTKMDADKISIIGYIALLGTFAMMIRSDALTEILKNISEKFKQ